MIENSIHLTYPKQQLRVYLALCLMALVTACTSLSIPPTPTEDRPTGIPTGIVVGLNNSSYVNLRSGPGTEFRDLDDIYYGARVELIGRNVENSWVHIRLVDGSRGWLIASAIQFDRNIRELPIVTYEDTDRATALAPTPAPEIIQADLTPAVFLGPVNGYNLTIVYSNTQPDDFTIIVNQPSDFTGLALQTIPKGIIDIVSRFTSLDKQRPYLNAGTCLRWIRARSRPVLPLACNSQQTFISELNDTDVFWYDSVRNLPYDVSLIHDNQIIGACSAAAAASALGCEFKSNS